MCQTPKTTFRTVVAHPGNTGHRSSRYCRRSQYKQPCAAASYCGPTALIWFRGLVLPACPSMPLRLRYSAAPQAVPSPSAFSESHIPSCAGLNG